MVSLKEKQWQAPKQPWEVSGNGNRSFKCTGHRTCGKGAPPLLCIYDVLAKSSASTVTVSNPGNTLHETQLFFIRKTVKNTLFFLTFQFTTSVFRVLVPSSQTSSKLCILYTHHLLFGQIVSGLPATWLTVTNESITSLPDF